MSNAVNIDSWQEDLARLLPLYGHRNWIVVADSAYPMQTTPGIDTLVAGDDQLDVVYTVFAAIENASHVRPIVHIDAELAYVAEEDAPGIDDYRSDLNEFLADHPVLRIPHDEIIQKLDEAGRAFRILIIKTNMTLPYTSVFFQLDCGYWSADAEARLRAAIAAHVPG